jgi:enterochelin esterase-like enzyme
MNPPPIEMVAPQASGIVGNHQIWRNVKGAHLSEARDVIVWLPPGYDENPDARYPVLYMHDGRQVFDPATSTWGKDWRVDDVAQEMIPAGKMAPCIVVASDCTARRNEEYGIGAEGEAYEAWLVEELKPAVDAAFRTDPARNAVAGASMGGLISFLIAWRRPDVFQSAGVLSPAFGSGFRGKESFTSLVKRFIDSTPMPDPPPVLFVSCGDGDPLEQDLLRGTEEIVPYLLSKGYSEEKIVRRFPLHGEPHNEESWSHLVPEFLPLFFPPAAE